MALSRRIWIYTAAIAAVLLYGTAGAYLLGSNGNFSVAISSPFDAFYFTIVTISTVGYGDITPVTGIARAFTIILIVSGLSIFLSAVTVLSGEFLSARIESIYSGSMRPDRKKLHNHIVLIGYDSTNSDIAERLKKQKRNFVIISGDKPSVDSLREKGYPAYVADYMLRSDLEKFNIGEASDVVIDLRDHSKTVYVALIMKKLVKEAKISAVVYDKEAEAHLSDLELDSIVNPMAIAADALTRVLDRDQDSRGARK